eukprot:scaffold706_cov418-Prasinococcus_capsulatus_cf.AAC.38
MANTLCFRPTTSPPCGSCVPQCTKVIRAASSGKAVCARCVAGVPQEQLLTEGTERAYVGSFLGGLGQDFYHGQHKGQGLATPRASFHRGVLVGAQDGDRGCLRTGSQALKEVCPSGKRKDGSGRQAPSKSSVVLTTPLRFPC